MKIERLEPTEPEFALHVTRQEMEAIKTGLGRLTSGDDQVIWGADDVKKDRSNFMWMLVRDVLETS